MTKIETKLSIKELKELKKLGIIGTKRKKSKKSKKRRKRETIVYIDPRTKKPIGVVENGKYKKIGGSTIASDASDFGRDKMTSTHMQGSGSTQSQGNMAIVSTLHDLRVKNDEDERRKKMSEGASSSAAVVVPPPHLAIKDVEARNALVGFGTHLQNGMTALNNKIRALQDYSRWGGGGFGVGTAGSDSDSFHSHENRHDNDVGTPLATGSTRFDDIPVSGQQSHPLVNIRTPNIDSDDADLITNVSSTGRLLQKHLSTIYEGDAPGDRNESDISFSEIADDEATSPVKLDDFGDFDEDIDANQDIHDDEFNLNSQFIGEMNDDQVHSTPVRSTQQEQDVSSFFDAPGMGEVTYEGVTIRQPKKKPKSDTIFQKQGGIEPQSRDSPPPNNIDFDINAEKVEDHIEGDEGDEHIETPRGKPMPSDYVEPQQVTEQRSKEDHLRYMKEQEKQIIGIVDSVANHPLMKANIEEENIKKMRRIEELHNRYHLTKKPLLQLTNDGVKELYDATTFRSFLSTREGKDKVTLSKTKGMSWYELKKKYPNQLKQFNNLKVEKPNIYII
jgi:hypothetical protein